VEPAQLPELYERAKIVLSECSRIDECQNWADKAAAMASYAKQSKDETLHRYADRIKARAITRCGELLKEIQPAHGANQNIKDGTVPNVTREQAAEGAGLSERQRKTALRVANVDPAVREELIESDNPPTITTLAELGTIPKLQQAEVVARGEKEIVAAAKAIRAARGAKKKAERIENVKRQAAEIAAATPTAPSGLFHVISIDPPWPYDEGKSAETYDPNGRRAANPYPEMSLEDIRDLVVPAADDCVLWLWTTHKFMRHSFDLLDAWGFADKAIVTWAKDRMGLGRWLRSQSEFCIMAVRGSPVINLTNQTTVLHGPLREHSRKPDEFYALVDSLCVGRKLDYFSRQPRDGWQQFGNDTERFCE
jgi:N6-adenosine-specific RNA methylase IME4